MYIRVCVFLCMFVCAYINIFIEFVGASIRGHNEYKPQNK